MKKKLYLLVSVVLVAALALGAGFGTMAYYAQKFVSNNTISTAKWDVGSTLADGVISISQFKPGDIKSYAFSVNKKDTEVPVTLQVQMKKYGELFTKTNPITLKLYYYNPTTKIKGAELATTQSDSTISVNGKDVPAISLTSTENAYASGNDFIIECEWPWGANTLTFDSTTLASADNILEGLTGNIAISLLAKQGTGSTVVETPTVVSVESERKVTIYTGFGSTDYISDDNQPARKVEVANNRLSKIVAVAGGDAENVIAVDEDSGYDSYTGQTVTMGAGKYIYDSNSGTMKYQTNINKDTYALKQVSGGKAGEFNANGELEYKLVTTKGNNQQITFDIILSLK